MRAAGARRDFSEVPAQVREQIETLLGAPVIHAESQPSGFSPGVAARVRLASGRRAFVKAVGPTPNPRSPDFHRRELEIVARLPSEAPVPRFLGGVDEDGWVALAFEDVDGRHPALPWRQDELQRVLAGAGRLVDALTPAPADVARAGEMLARTVASWHLLRDDPPLGLDEWSKRHAGRLADLEARVVDIEGETLVHLDIREDNVLLARDCVFFVDWPHAHIGPPWLDAVCFAPSVTMQGGPEPEKILSAWPGGDNADAAQVNACVAAIAGFFTQRALLPPEQGLPGLREFQAAQGAVARRWLAERTGLR